jgi:hypothetical protein
MINETYDIIALGQKPYFYFESEGEKGKIPKLIIFTPIGNNLWNLAFGDIKNGNIDDAVVSNNHDIVKIFNTIAKVVYEFSAENPNRRIRIRPVDEKRGRLYNHIFRRNYEVISTNFNIIGINKRRKEPYSPEKFYEYFEIIRKFVQ